MNIKELALHHGMKLMSDPRVVRLMQDEQVMKTMMSAMSFPGRIFGAAQEHSDRIARKMSLATEQEIRDLRRTVRSLEDQLAELKHEVERIRDHNNTK